MSRDKLAILRSADEALALSTELTAALAAGDMARVRELTARAKALTAQIETRLAKS